MAARELPLEDRKPVTAEDLRALLRRKFPADQFAMLYEVRDAAGFHANRSADVVMVGLWPSRGCQVEGMEIKVSRGDWLRELARPEKGEAFVKFCDRWWVVAANDDIVEDHELPKAWGLMIAGGRGLKIAKAAPALKAGPVDRWFLAAMLKRATGARLDSPDMQAAIQSAVKAAQEGVRHELNYDSKSKGERIARLERVIAEFKEASGVDIDSYHAGHIGAAVRTVMNGEHLRAARQLQDLKGTARRIVARIEELVPDPPEADDARP